MSKDSPLDVTIFAIRRRLFDGMLMAMVILSIPALAASLYRIKHIGWSYALYLQIVLLILIWCIYFFRNKVSIRIRTAALLILFYVIGFTGYLSYGLSGAGPQWIMMAVVLITLFFGRRLGLVALAVNVLFVIGLSIAVTHHWVKFAVDFNVYNEASSSWITQIAAVGFFLGILVVVADRLYSALIDAIRVAQQQTAEIQKRADDLQDQITERKRAEDRLALSEQQLRAILQASPIGIGKIKDRVFEWVNEKLCQVMGYRLEEFQGRNSLFLYENETEYALAGEILYKEGVVETRWIHKNGNVRDISIQITQTTSYAYIFTVMDITERKHAEEGKRSLEERLQRAEKMEALGQLAGGVAHDLNNVLGVLSGYTELLLMGIHEGQRSRGYAEKILQSVDKGAAIIQDLLTLARRGVTASDVINLNSVVSGFLKTPVFEKMRDYHPRVTFRTEYDQNLLNIKGSSIHLEKTLMNLVSNAAEAISEKGEVTIRTESRYLEKAVRGYDEIKEGDYTILTVADTGMGIPAENKEKIFEPFYTKKTMGRSGTGLGLAIVWGTVKDHKGYIDVQTKVGEGTTFTLYFPVTREELIAQQQKVPIEQYMGKGEFVLVVDDIAEQRDVASSLLTELGYEVHLVSSGEDAVEYLKGNKADILMLDMVMAPGIDGLETYQRVLEINPKQKAILVSGFSETDRVKKARKLGAGAYVKKPYVMEKIGVAIRDELDRK